MSKTKKETDFWGNENEVHYDDKGDKIGETKSRDTLFSGTVHDHYDKDGNKVGETRREEGIFSDRAVHFDAEGNKVGHSKDDETILGTRFQRHFDDDGDQVGVTHYEKTLLGNTIKVHEGEFFKASSDAGIAPDSASSRSTSPDSGANGGGCAPGAGGRGGTPRSTSASNQQRNEYLRDEGSADSPVTLRFLLLLLAIGVGVAYWLLASVVPIQRMASPTSAKTPPKSPRSTSIEPIDWSKPPGLMLKRFGSLRVGMAVSEVEAAAGTLRVEPGQDPGCFLVSPMAATGLSLMISDGRLARIDIETKEFATLSGIRVGDTTSRVVERYGSRIQVSRHKYVESGSYLTFVPTDDADRSFGMIFETDGNVVTQLRAGKQPEVGYVERCH